MRVFLKVPSALRIHWGKVAMLCMCLAGGWLQAQTLASSSDVADPPSRVARLAYISGDVGFLPAGASTWSDANINRPLTTGDRLSTGANARVELEFGGTNLRMDGGTDFGVLDLNEQLAQIELTQGTLGLGVRDLSDGQSVEIDTPTVALIVDRPGTLRVDVADGGRGTQVSVFAGSAVVYGENNAQRNLVAGRSYQFDDSALKRVVVSDLPGEDAFDAWGRERDQRYARSPSSQYVSDQVVGYQDLDQYGAWQTDNDYGAVWYPTQVASTWAPYSDGHWAYIAPWGWSWVDAAPWGFAPYHYGRWANMRGRWGWIPGPISVRPVYAPALVAFVGGGGWSVGIGSGPVGWFPLGPGEIYNPWYRASRNYYNNVNITNIYVRRGYDRSRFGRDLDNHYDHYRRGDRVRDQRYVNRGAPRGFTTVPGRTFASGQRVHGGADRVEQRALATAEVLPRGVGARPVGVGTSLPRNTHTRSLPLGGFDREVVARRAPPALHGTLADAQVRSARGSEARQVAASRVRLLAPDAQSGRAGARSVPQGEAAAAADVNRLNVGRANGDRVGVRPEIQDQMNAAENSAAQRSANRDLVRNRHAADIRPVPASVGRVPRRDAGPVAADATQAGQPAGTLPSVAPIRRADLRSGELPSSRFARPDRRLPMPADGAARSAGGQSGVVDDAVRPTPMGRSPRDQRDATVRPGLSIISADNAERARPSGYSRPASAQDLPQVPRFERGAVDNAGGAVAAQQAAMAERQRSMQRNAPMNEPAVPQRQAPMRFERPEPARDAPQQVPRAMAPRQMQAAPSAQYQRPQVDERAREMPRAAMAQPPRPVAPPPVRVENRSRPAQKSDDRARRDQQQN